MMGGITDIDYEEEKAVRELQMRVENDLTPAMREDTTLFYRFLKARDFDVDKAEKMLRKNINWRKIYQADTVLQDFKPSEFFVKHTEPSFIGFDKDGDMLVYTPLGNFSVHEVFNSTKLNNFMRHWTWFAEKHIALLNENSKKTGNCRYQGTLIANLDQLTIKNATSKLSANLLLLFLHMYQDNYPERMKYLYVINAPSYYRYIFSILKTVMSPFTVQKIRIFGQDGWKEILLEFIDPEVLPAFLGGNRTDPDGNPSCRSFINHGGKIPEKYCLTDKDRYFQSGTQVKKISLCKQEKKEINVDIEEAGLLIKWEFLVRNKDIGFGLYYQHSQNEIQEVIPIQRYDTSDGTEKDSYKCRLPGTYIIIFDNTYSWLTSKTVEYSIDVERPMT